MNERLEIELEAQLSRLRNMRTKGYGCWWESEDEKVRDQAKAHRCMDCDYKDKDDYCIQAKKACLILQMGGKDPVAPLDFGKGIGEPASASAPTTVTLSREYAGGSTPDPQAPPPTEEELMELPLSTLEKMGLCIHVTCDWGEFYLVSDARAMEKIKDPLLPVFFAEELRKLAPLTREVLQQVWKVKKTYPRSQVDSVQHELPFEGQEKEEKEEAGAADKTSGK